MADDKYTRGLENIARFSEAHRKEEEEKAKLPPPPPKPGVQDFSSIPPGAFKKGSVLNEVLENKFDPVHDTISETVATGVTAAKKKKGKNGSLKGSTGAAPHPSSRIAKRDDSAEEKERVALIKKHNKYVKSQVIARHLVKGGYQLTMLPPNASLEEARSAMDEINESLSSGASKSMVMAGMMGLNRITEHFVPELRKETPDDFSLSDVFLEGVSNPDTSLALSVEELSIAFEPYAPAGNFLARLGHAYFNMCMGVYNLKIQRNTPGISVNGNVNVTEDDVMGEDDP